jgi:undecaprenyl-diphosphatase
MEADEAGRATAADRAGDGDRPAAGTGHLRRPLHLLLPVLAVLLPVALFLLLAEGVVGGSPGGIDAGVLRALEQVQSAALTVFLRVVTFLGGDWGVVIPTAAAVVVLLIVDRPRLRGAVFVAVVMAGTGVLQLLTKLLFERPRPGVFPPLVAVASYSYPSGHAMASAGLALAVGLLAWRTRWRLWAVAGGLAFVLLVGLSRMYLGVHYPSDIVAGWLLAVAWVAWTWLAFEVAGRPLGGIRRSGVCPEPAAGGRQTVAKL